MSNKNIFSNFRCAFKGLYEGIKEEKIIKLAIFCMFIVIILGFVFNISLQEWIACITLFALVICLELVNTSIEKVVDMESPKFNKLAGSSKDIAASSVLLASIFSIVIGLIIFLPKVLELIKK